MKSLIKINSTILEMILADYNEEINLDLIMCL